MDNDKSKFFIFRSPLLWVALGLAITLIGFSVETAAHFNTVVPPNHVEVTVNLQTGAVSQVNSCNVCVENRPPSSPKLSVPEVKVHLAFYQGSNCVTIYHNGNPIEVCGP